MADIEDCSILPSDQQLQELAKHLPVIETALFDKARTFGGIPWAEAVGGILANGNALMADEIAAHFASASSQCSAGWVLWRLNRQLARLERSGDLTQGADGKWAATALRVSTKGVASRSASGDRWREHSVATRHDPEQDALFHLESEPGSHHIVLNRSHPHHEVLHWALALTDLEGLTEQELRDRLLDVVELLRDLVVAWAVYEDDEKAGPRQDRVREARQCWGRAAKEMAWRGQLPPTSMTL